MEASSHLYFDRPSGSVNEWGLKCTTQKTDQCWIRKVYWQQAKTHTKYQAGGGEAKPESKWQAGVGNNLANKVNGKENRAGATGEEVQRNRLGKQASRTGRVRGWTSEAEPVYSIHCRGNDGSGEQVRGADDQGERGKDRVTAGLEEVAGLRRAAWQWTAGMLWIIRNCDNDSTTNRLRVYRWSLEASPRFDVS